MNRIIRGVGSCLPAGSVSNTSLEARLGLAEGWIERRTGIRSRRICAADQATSELAIQAARRALEDANLPAAECKALVLSTSTPDHPLPPTAPMVAAQLGTDSIPAFDMAVACSGFVYGLAVASGLVDQFNGPVLLIAANVLSRRCNPTDAATVSLFADGAGAVVLDRSPDGDRGIIALHLESAGADWDCLMTPAGGSRQPITHESLDEDLQYMQIGDGHKVFRYAVESMERCALNVLQQAGVASGEVDWLVPHQANQRIINELSKRLLIEPSRIANYIAEFGNSSAATIPIALAEMRQRDLLLPGQRVLLTAAGAGLAAGAAVIRW